MENAVTRVLKLVFVLSNMKNLTINITAPKANLTQENIEEYFEDVIGDNVIQTIAGFRAENFGESYYYDTEKIIID